MIDLDTFGYAVSAGAGLFFIISFTICCFVLNKKIKQIESLENK